LTTGRSEAGTYGRDVLVSTGFTGLIVVSALANSIVIAQMVGTEGRGLYALIVAVCALAWPIVGGGLNHAATWRVGAGSSVSRVATLNHLWMAGVLLVGGASAAAVLVINKGIPRGDVALVVLAASLIVPAMIYCELARGLMLGLKRVWAFNGIALTTALCLLVANLALLRWGPRYVLVALAVAYWAPALVIAALHLRRIRGAQLPDRELTGTSLRYGVRAGGTTLAETTLMRVDVLLMAIWIPVADVGIYSIADQCAHMVAMLGIVAGRMMLAQSANDPSGEQSRKKLGLAARLLVAITAMATLVAAATAWFLIPLAFGEDFAPAWIGMLLLMPAALAKGLYALFSTYLLGRGVASPVARAGAAAIVVEVVGVLAVAATFGWMGVAVVKTVAYAVQAIVTFSAYRASPGAEPIRWVLDGADLRALRRWLVTRLRSR
jgi:O-antigen/teichoic acid export membrane protein